MSRHLSSAWLIICLLLALVGCIVEPRPYTYRVAPVRVYDAPPPPPLLPPPALAPTPEPTPPPPAMTATPAAPANVSPDTPADVPPPPSQEQPDVLTRGPVHEAFAQPVAMQNETAMPAVETQPPANVTETPPVERPAGGAIWAPGYWSWDAERNNYIWVSGCWRLPPPRMSWIPGYWTSTPGGWQWVPGFWSPTAPEALVYLPAPPAVTDIQPPGPPPMTDDFWVPSCYYWYQEHYVLRSGYWLHPQTGWIWAPSHCTWTPRGHVFVEGHWDYALERRGVLFAPVYFPGRISTGVRVSFSPSVTIDIGVLSTHLFACPRYEHYYFGDYYDGTYVQIGIYPWFDCVRVGTWYDPLFVYARWNHGRSDHRWEEHEREDFRHRQDHRDLRPPRTYREQETRLSHLPPSERSTHEMARPLSTVVRNPSAAMRFEHVDAAAHQRDVQQVQASRNVREVRSHRESSAPVRPPANTTAPIAPTRSPRTTPVTATHDSASTRDSTPTRDSTSKRDNSASRDSTPATSQPDLPRASSPTPTEPGTTRRTSDHPAHSNLSPVPTTPRTTTPTTAPSEPKQTSTTATEPDTSTRTRDRTDRNTSATGHTTAPTTVAPVASPATAVGDTRASSRGNDSAVRGTPVTSPRDVTPTTGYADRTHLPTATVKDPIVTSRSDRFGRNTPATTPRTTVPGTTTPVTAPTDRSSSDRSSTMTASGTEPGTYTRGSQDQSGDYRHERSREER